MGKKDNEKGRENLPEAMDALDAVEAVIDTTRRRKNFFEANIIPLKDDSKKERRRKMIFDMLLLVMLGCALVLLWVLVIDPWNSARKLEDLNKLRGDTSVVEVSTDPDGEVEPLEQETKPANKVRETAEELLKRNGDYKCWISAPGANIEYPVVQTRDNNYYLYRDFDLKPSRYGNPFIDFRNTLDPLSTNMIIYGHHMRNGTIFSKLGNYRQRDVVARHPLITLEWPDGTTTQYKIFSVFAINGKAKDDNGYVFAANTPDFPDQESFDGFVRQLKQRTYVNTGVDVEYGDNLISLQTCIYDFDYEFLYVVGRMVRSGESAKVDASQIKSNNSPRLPQALYDKLGRKNPYKNAELWEPPT